MAKSMSVLCFIFHFTIFYLLTTPMDIEVKWILDGVPTNVVMEFNKSIFFFVYYGRYITSLDFLGSRQICKTTI